MDSSSAAPTTPASRPQYPDLRKLERTSRTFACALLAALLAFAWQVLVVRYDYAGNWTGLFSIGDRRPAPPALAERDLYRFHDSPGYDGQFYYYIAHDLFARTSMKDYVDNAPLRWRRILVPALAHVLALGRPEYIPAAYIFVILASVFAGAWWTSRFLQRSGFHAFWGLAFLLVPATAVSVDRMTVDVALAALCVAFAVYGFIAASWRVYAVLVLAPLVRETGLALVAAFVLFLVIRKCYERAALAAACALPWLVWALFVRYQLWADGTSWTTLLPVAPLIARTLHPVQFAITSRGLALAAALDYLGLLGVWAAVAIAARFAWKKNFELLPLAAIVFAAAVMFVSKPDVWADSYAFGRTMSPLFIWPALMATWSRSWLLSTPLALNVPRIALQILLVSLPVIR